MPDPSEFAVPTESAQAVADELRRHAKFYRDVVTNRGSARTLQKANRAFCLVARQLDGRADSLDPPTDPAPDLIDTTPDLGDREELVDVLDTHMRLDDRADAERVADALIARPALLRALSSRAASTCTTLLGVPLDVSDALGPYGWRTLDMFGGVLASGVWTPTSPLDGNTLEVPDGD